MSESNAPNAGGSTSEGSAIDVAYYKTLFSIARILDQTSIGGESTGKAIAIMKTIQQNGWTLGGIRWSVPGPDHETVST